MRTQPPPLRRVALTIAFSLMCVVLLIAAWVTVGGSVPLQAHGYRVAVTFDEAPGLPTGSGVQVAGVRVGRVVSVARDGSQARVTIEIDAKYAPLRRGTLAQLRSKTLLGEGFVELAPGPKDAATIAEGGRLPARDARDAVQLDEALSTFSPRARRSFRQMFAGMGRTFGDHATDVGDATGAMAPAAGGMRDVFGVLDEQRPALQGLLSGAADVLSAVGEREGSVRASLAAGNRFLATTSARRRELEQTVAALPPFLRQLRATSRVLGSAGDDLERATGSLLGVSGSVAPALRSISDAAPSFERMFGELTPTAKAGTRGLPALTRIVRSTPPALRQLYPAARQLAPVAGLAAADRHDAIGIIANIGSVMNGVAVGPNGKVMAYGTGFATLWNEAIGGYEKKLPTNRPNPYPKPGALRLKDTGYLKSFQCRHTGNKLLVAPTGTGVPPCTEQGPWPLLGKTQYYPALTPAPAADTSKDR